VGLFVVNRSTVIDFMLGVHKRVRVGGGDVLSEVDLLSLLHF